MCSFYEQIEAMKENKVKIIKYAPPPPDLPIYGQVSPDEFSFFGRTNYETDLESKKFIFGVKRKDRRRHFYIVGKSGTGKSKLLELFIRQDIICGHGVCLMDSHGDVVADILDFVPENRIKDVILIDPSDAQWPASFNPLFNIAPELRHRTAQGLTEIMEKQFGANWTPRLEYIFRFISLALLDYPRATIQGMILMLTDHNYRQKVIKYIEDEAIKRFWAIEFVSWSERFDAEAIIPLLNKLGKFFSNPLLRYIFSQKEGKVNIEKIINEKKILLINLSKGKLDEESFNFFSSIFIFKIHQAGVGRASMPKEEKKDFYLYIDEFYDITTDAFVNILTETKKYGIALTITHQYRAQFSSQIMAIILNNVANMVIFRLGGEDAKFFEKEMAPVFKDRDMINLGMQEFYIKMIINGEAYDPFSAKTLNILPAVHPSYRDKIIKHNHQVYCMSLEEVKREIAEEEGLIIA